MLNNDELQKQVQELSDALKKLEGQLLQYQENLKVHQHTGIDSSSQTEGKPDLKAATLSLSGGVSFGASVGSAPLNIYDIDPDISQTRCSFGAQINVIGKGSAGEQMEGVLAVGKNIITLPNIFDFDAFNTAEVSILHLPNDILHVNQTPFLTTPPYSFFIGIRTPFIDKTKSATGLIVNAGNTLTDTTLNLKINSLVGCRIVLYSLNAQLQKVSLEAHIITVNTQTVITISGSAGWLSASGNYFYEVYNPMFLGSADNPWRCLYVDNENGLAIRFGVGPTSGTQFMGFYYAYGDPNGFITANPGSIYMNLSAGAGTTLYIKESGVQTNTGWVAYGVAPAVTSINGRYHGTSTTTVPATYTPTKMACTTQDFLNGITWDAANHRFTALTAGQYVVIGVIGYTSITDGKTYCAEIYKNGSLVGGGTRVIPGASGVPIYIMVSDIVDLAIGGYVELYTEHSNSVDETVYNSVLTYFSIAKV